MAYLNDGSKIYCKFFSNSRPSANCSDGGNCIKKIHQKHKVDD